MKGAPVPSERKELFCGGLTECTTFLQMLGDSSAYEIVTNEGPGPACSVYRKRKRVDPTIKAPVSRLTRQTFRVQGVTGERNRPLWVTLEPGDLLTFCPKGTRQKVTVPLASLYHFARFAAARAAAAAKRAARKGAK